jgi:DNA-binding MarR family transcriptional regulator
VPSWKNARLSSGKPMQTKPAPHSVNQPDVSVDDTTLRGFIGYDLKRASNIVQNDLAQALKPFGLRMLTYTALVLIVDNPGLRQAQLAEAMEVERPNLVLVIDELERREWVLREKVPTDRRAYALMPTLLGCQICAQAVRAVTAHERTLFQHLNAQQQSDLVALLRRFQASQGEGQV